MKPELFMLEGKELEEIKRLSEKVLELLPTDPKKALIVLRFLEENIANETNIRVKDIIVK